MIRAELVPQVSSHSVEPTDTMLATLGCYEVDLFNP